MKTIVNLQCRGESNTYRVLSVTNLTEPKPGSVLSQEEVDDLVRSTKFPMSTLNVNIKA